MSGMLFGVDDDAELVYRLALARGTAEPVDLASWLRWPVERLRAAVTTLVEGGLCATEGDRIRALPQDETARRHEVALERQGRDARLALAQDVAALRASELAAYLAGRKRTSTNAGVELVRDLGDVVAVMLDFHRNARRHVQFSVTSPPFPGGVEEYQILSDEMIAGPIEMRGVWVDQVRTRPPSARLVALAKLGGVRTVEQVPLRAIVWDGLAALVTADPREAPGSGALVIRNPVLADLVGQHVDRTWQRARTWDGETNRAELTSRHRAILSLLANGSTEEAVGRKLGVSQRTVRRYVADIYRVLGVNSKVALGAEAVRRGLIS